VTVTTDDGAEHEVFLKVSGRPELSIEHLANEALAACVAGDLGLPILEPFLVTLTDEWIESILDQSIQALLHDSATVAFGLEAAGQQWKIWSEEETLWQERRSTALAIFAFDVYCENSDRRPGSNPNCLVSGNEFRIIDHELCFWIRTLLPRPEPWRMGYIQNIVDNDRHIFGSKLKGKALEFDPIRARWSGLQDDRLESYLGWLPGEWASASAAMVDAVGHIRNVRDKIDDCLAELERALA
jgi:hypothetical protein